MAPRRILLVRLSHLGDVVHALPVWHALRYAYPGADLAWAIQPEFAPLVAGLPGAPRIVPFERRGGARAWVRLARRLEAFGAEWAIDAQGNTKSALVTLLSGAQRRSGLAREDWRERFAFHALTDSAPPLSRRRGPVHAMERMLGLADHVAPLTPREVLLGGPRPSRAERARAEALLENLLALGPPAPPILIALATPGDVRAWPTRAAIECAQRLAAAGRAVIVLSGPAERREGAKAAAALAGKRGIAHLIGQRGLRELAALFAAAADRGGRLVACDSGPMHLAASVGLPVTLLAGPQDPSRTGPWPPPGPTSAHRVLRLAEPLSCAPCLARRCRHVEGPICMERLSAQRVAQALLAEPVLTSSSPGE